MDVAVFSKWRYIVISYLAWELAMTSLVFTI
jgi:hypothetical protein